MTTLNNPQTGWMTAKIISINGQKLTRRRTRSWVQCDECEIDIKFGTNVTIYWETAGKKRYCAKCLMDFVNSEKKSGRKVLIQILAKEGK